eukprot:g15263.t1
MASRKGYKSLPADSSAVSEGPPTPDAEQPAAEAAGGPAAAAVGGSMSAAGAERGSFGEREGPAPGRDATSGGGSRKEASGAGTAGESDGKDANPTGGLPVTEGVFVGDPITQSSYGTLSGGGGAYSPSAPQATIVTAPAAAAATAGGDGRGIAMPHQGTGQHTVIVMNAPPGHQFGEWGRDPQPFVCRACGFSGFTATMTDPCSNMPILAAACCCLVGLWPCSFVPFLIPELRDTVHRCPNCHIPVGRSRQFR